MVGCAPLGGIHTLCDVHNEQSAIGVTITVVRALLKVIPLRYQVMVGRGSPEALQWRVSEALLMSAFIAKTTMSSGS